MDKWKRVVNGVSMLTNGRDLLNNYTSKLNWLNKEQVEAQYEYLFIKRICDVVISGLALVVLIPLFLVIAIAIKLDDPKGLVLFSQIRVGKNGEEFKMLKFRSMCVDAEDKLSQILSKNEVDGAMFKMKEDPRVTKVGHFIRRRSLDELPQLWNVLIGNMSLVGPRPPLPYEIKKYTDYDFQRLLVKPGCTGLWQVTGRNDVDFHEMVDLDIHYIKNRTIYFDLGILCKTLVIMIHPNGAY